jgi:hypothetical protein
MNMSMLDLTVSFRCDDARQDTYLRALLATARAKLSLMQPDKASG